MADLNVMQKKLLEMLKFFHSFCERNALRYYTVGGTTLGAIRHNGFIPWDDDIDIGMPREDYDRLITIFDNINDSPYIIESPSSDDPNYLYPYSKMYDTSTTLVENTRYRLKRGIFLDIFPLDGVGNSFDKAKRKYRILQMEKNYLTYRSYIIDNKRSWYKNVGTYIIQHIPGFIAGEKRIIQIIEKQCRAYSFDESYYVGNLVGAWGIKEIMPREYFGNPTLHKFEDTVVYIEEKPDEFLTHIYGNWRELPPIDKRQSHHDYYLDLRKSYLA